MATDYGALKDVVAVSGSLVAAAGAIGVSWTRRAKWMPPEETVPHATARTSGLICAVVIGSIYLLRTRLGTERLLVVSGSALGLAVLFLIVSIYVNTAHSFKRRSAGRAADTRVLGGFRLTGEAQRIAQERSMGSQALLDHANGDSDLVWTRPSQATAQIFSTLGFIGLQAAGSIALAAVAIAFGISSI